MTGRRYEVTVYWEDLNFLYMSATIGQKGRLAQRLERCVDIAEVTGSNPVSPMLGKHDNIQR